MIKYKYITDRIDDELIFFLTQFNIYGVDTETGGLDCHSCDLRLIQLSVEEKNRNVLIFIFDLYKLPKDEHLKLNQVFKDKKLIIHNGKFEYKFFYKAGIDLTECKSVYCTLICEQLIINGKTTPNGKRLSASLASVAKRRLGISLDKTEQISDWSREELTKDQLEYAALDVFYLHEIRRKQIEKLKVSIAGKNLLKIAEIELNFIPVLSALEYNGIFIDKDKILKLKQELEKEKEELETEIYKTLPNIYFQQSLFSENKYYSINLKSKQSQLLPKLKEIGIEINKFLEINSKGIEVEKESINEAELKKHKEKFPICGLLINLAKVDKAISTYTISLIEKINKFTNRVHPNYNQLGASSGRMTTYAKEFPALTIPKETKYKSCLKAQGTNWISDYDYNQIESRLVARAANEIKMLNIFNNDEDIYAATAAFENGYSLEEFNNLKINNPELFKNLRQTAKSEVLGLSFGLGAEGYRDYVENNFGIVKTLEEATKDRNRFLFSTYPNLPMWHKKQWNKFKDKFYVQNENGRVRYWDKPLYNVAINYEIQSLATEIIKVAQTKIFYELKKKYGVLPLFDRSPIWQTQYIHDQVTFEGISLEVLKENDNIIESNLVNSALEMINNEVVIKAEGNFGLDYSCH